MMLRRVKRPKRFPLAKTLVVGFLGLMAAMILVVTGKTVLMNKSTVEAKEETSKPVSLAKKKSSVKVDLLSVSRSMESSSSSSEVAVADASTVSQESSQDSVTETAESTVAVAAPSVEGTVAAEVVTESQLPVSNETGAYVAAANNNYVAEQVAYAQAAPATNYGYTLANGNTAGEIGSEAAAQMAAATGVPQSTWEYIIARESNGNPNAYNPSGASGLFQTIPGWGSTATVQDQINSAINAYNAQGLAAWGMQ